MANVWRIGFTLVVLAAIGASACEDRPTEVTSDFEVTSHAADWRGEVIYQLMVDRFANGDPNNDHGVVEGDLGRYQGGDWQGVIDHVDYLVDLGVTTVWISPVVRNVESDAGFDGYHGYWTQDFLDVNPHFGDVAKLREMVQVLHAHGILVILDIVTNHVGQVFYYDINKNGRPDDSVQGSGTTSPVLRVGEYDPDFDIRGVQAFTSLGGSGPAPIDWVRIPSLNRGPPEPAEFANPEWYWRRGRVTVWGREADACRDAGIDPADWDACYAYVRIQEVTGDFPGGLKDLRTDLPEVREALIRVMTHWIDAADIDGFRIDTVKHVEHDFWIQFATAVREYAYQVGKDRFFMFGEVFDGADWLLGSYTQPGMLDSVFYFSQKFQVYDAVFKYGAPTTEIEALWAERRENYGSVGQGAVVDADGRAIPPQELLVNFLDNHDVPRFLYDQPSRAHLHAALSLLFLEDGMPCIYYGTEQGFAGGNDPGNREPLWWSGYDRTHPTYQLISRLSAVRRRYPELSFGTLRIAWSTPRTGDEADAGVFAFERRYHGARAMVIVNTNATHASVTSAESLGHERMTTTFAPGTELIDVYPGSDRSVFTVSTEGCATVACTQPVADDYEGAACGCLLVDVDPLQTRILVERDRAQPDDTPRSSTRD
ncbi:MAG: alpha-amylase [Myxococcales bacterium]|nr:alpha-amylase [Myxococcales bacterium]MCB9520577.1 alpha-amylase [Myxococcales bacterium]MCB9531500.1 alpha-amylase [Myxococcales bacterium]